MSITMDLSDRVRGRALLSVHDVTPSNLAFLAGLLPLLRDVGVTAMNLAVVPRFHDGEAWADDVALRQAVAAGGPAARTEIMQHGCYHARIGGNERLTGLARVRSGLQSAGEDEFYRLDPHEAEDRIRYGRAVIETVFGRPPSVFVPPAWAGALSLRGLLKGLGFSATEDHLWIHDLETGRKILSPAIAFATRSKWRERLSRTWARLVPGRLAAGAILRFAFHPSDLRSPAVRDLALGVLDGLSLTREWMLYEDVLRPDHGRS
jgi:predicted deacetylase